MGEDLCLVLELEGGWILDIDLAEVIKGILQLIQ